VGGLEDHRRYPVAYEFSAAARLSEGFPKPSTAALSCLRRNRGPFKP
jgi:hypothetical protein